MTEGPWRIDPGLASGLAEALGWGPEDGPGALARRFAERIPTGSTAKLAALAAGETPPGAEVDALARQILEELTARVTARAPTRSEQGEGGPGRRTPALEPRGEGAPDHSTSELEPGVELAAARRTTPAWTCWVVSSVFAAIVDTLGPETARVAALRRIDDRSPVVDIHSVVVVGPAGATGDGTANRATWICDPYFGAALALPVGPADRGRTMPGPVVATEPETSSTTEMRIEVRTGPESSTDQLTHASEPDEHAGACAVTLEDDGRWTFAVQLRVWDGWLRYRVLAPQLDRADLAAFCAISATHSGAPDHPYARIHRPGAMCTLQTDAAGTTTVSQRAWDGPDGPVAEDRTTQDTWAEGVEAFATITGVTIGE